MVTGKNRINVFLNELNNATSEYLVQLKFKQGKNVCKKIPFNGKFFGKKVALHYQKRNIVHNLY